MSPTPVLAPPRPKHAAPPSPHGPVVRVARWSATHRWTALSLWIAFVVAAVFLGGAVQTRQIEGADGAIGASAPADRALDGADFGDLPVEQVLVQDRSGAPLDPADPVLADLAAGLADAAGVAAVAGPLPSEDGGSALFRAELAAGDLEDDARRDAAAQAATAVGEVVSGTAAAHPDLRIEQVGDATIDAALDTLYEDDLQRAEVLSLPVTLAILVVAFGALIAAGVPVLLALSSVAAALGLSALASYVVPSTEVLSSVVLLVGMAVGVDYSLFYVRREREERERGRGTLDAITVAAATSGRAVVVSGVAVVVAMAGMFLAGESTFASLAVGTILVVSVAVLGSVTVLPALLAILGRWVDRPRVPLLWRLQRRSGGSRFWPVVLRPVLARPAVALAVGTAALVALALPALGMRLASPGVEDLPRSLPAMQAYDRLVAAYPSEGAAHTVVAWSTDGRALDRQALDAAVAELGQRQGTPLTAEYAEGGAVARVLFPLPYAADDERAAQSLADLRADLLPDTVAAVDGVDAAVTGMTAWDVDFRDLLEQRMPLVVGFVLLLTVVVLVLSFRSLSVALTAAALNLLSVAASYGLLTLVFQGEWAEGLLGFESNGAIMTWLPLFLFVILFGLSMDYHVFVVSRIREGVASGMPTRAAVAHGITRSAGVVTSAAVVMVAVFAIFATLTALEFKQMGVGLAAAILIDATVVRAVLLPSAMALLGERNWWLPRWMEVLLRRAPRLEHA